MAMRRFQMMLDEELDAALEREASQRRVSKAEVARRLLRQGIAPLPPLEHDPLWSLVGADDDSTDSGEQVHVDDVVYGP